MKNLFREISLFSGCFQIEARKFVFICIFVRTTLPFLVRWALNIKLKGYDSIIFTIVEILMQLFLLLVNYMFIWSGLVDFHRRFIMLKACSSLLNPVKDNLDLKYQLFPTINLACKKSVFSWY